MRPAATRFATAFLTLQSLWRHRISLKGLFVTDDWNRSKLSSTEIGKNVCETVLANRFWNAVENCIRASQPLIVVLRIVDGDEKPTMPEVTAAMDLAKKKINDSLENKTSLLRKVITIIERRWKSQMEQKLYGAALFLNPNRFFKIRRTKIGYASRLRTMFNDMLENMIIADDKQAKISNQADDYENMQRGFSSQLAIKQQKDKSPSKHLYFNLILSFHSFQDLT